MHSNNKDNDEQFKAFNSYTGKSMLLTVSMVLEGIHPKNVEGVLLYRNVTKEHVLIQVLGRICKINSDISPVCVDIFKSIDNIPKSYISK